MLIPPYICNEIIATRIRRFNMNLGIKAMTYHPQVFLGLVVVMRDVCRKVKYRMLVTKYLHMKVQFNRFSRVWYIWLKYETCALATLIYHFLKTYL